MDKQLTKERMDEILNLLNEVFRQKCAIIDTLLKDLDEIRKIRVELKIDQHCMTNILDIINPTELQISKILCSILSLTQDGEYYMWRSFTEKFLSRCGFDTQWINQPDFSSEKYRIDILVKECQYAVIIENKIHDAIFQRNQLARYINITKSLINSDDIFIVLLPKESYRTINDIPESVWRLPCDWDASNNERKCALRGDSTLCACDIENLSEGKQNEFNCKECTNFKMHYLNRTKILGNAFLDWLLEIKNTSEDTIIRSGMVLVSDYFNGIRSYRNNDFIMEITEYLRLKLFSKDDSVSDKFKKISEMKESVNDLGNGLNKLAVTYSEELIEKWYKSFKNWYDQIEGKGTCQLEYSEKTSFYIEIKGIQIGCWSGEDNGNPKYYNYPYWGFKNVKNDETRDNDMIERIKSRANVEILHENAEGSFLAWGSTTHGVEDLKKYIQAAMDLGYMSS